MSGHGYGGGSYARHPSDQYGQGQGTPPAGRGRGASAVGTDADRPYRQAFSPPRHDDFSSRLGGHQFSRSPGAPSPYETDPGSPFAATGGSIPVGTPGIGGPTESGRLGGSGFGPPSRYLGVQTTASGLTLQTDPPHSRGPGPKERVRRHKCDVCGKLFERPSAVETHMRKHTGEKPFTCSHCPKRFSINSNRLRHEKHLHSNVSVTPLPVMEEDGEFEEDDMGISVGDVRRPPGSLEARTPGGMVGGGPFEPQMLSPQMLSHSQSEWRGGPRTSPSTSSTITPHTYDPASRGSFEGPPVGYGGQGAGGRHFVGSPTAASAGSRSSGEESGEIDRSGARPTGAASQRAMAIPYSSRAGSTGAGSSFGSGSSPSSFGQTGGQLAASGPGPTGLGMTLPQQQHHAPYGYPGSTLGYPASNIRGGDYTSETALASALARPSADGMGGYYGSVGGRQVGDAYDGAFVDGPGYFGSSSGGEFGSGSAAPDMRGEAHGRDAYVAADPSSSTRPSAARDHQFTVQPRPSVGSLLETPERPVRRWHYPPVDDQGSPADAYSPSRLPDGYSHRR